MPPTKAANTPYVSSSDSSESTSNGEGGIEETLMRTARARQLFALPMTPTPILGRILPIGWGSGWVGGWMGWGNLGWLLHVDLPLSGCGYGPAPFQLGIWTCHFPVGDMDWHVSLIFCTAIHAV